MADAVPRASIYPRLAPWQATQFGLHWRLFDLDDPSLTAASTLLDSDERARAARFHFKHDRDRYTAAHAALRLSLAEVLNQAPDRVSFCYGEHGKPMLAIDQGWVFNLSHSDNVALIALAPSDCSADIGVDIERVRPIADWDTLADAHFSRPEYQALAVGRSDERSSSFLRCWTRKEACLKAIGTGLTLSPSTFTVGVLDGDMIVSIKVDGHLRSVRVGTILQDDTLIGAIACSERRS
jgi:4'-phosphopantetheinyl transferase